MTVPLDLTVPGRYHVVGIGGPGMSAIGLVLAEMGHAVSGSDIREAAVLERLRAAGITINVGHDPAVVEGVDAVTASTAIPERNVELRRSRELGIPTLRRAGMLASICACARTVAVAGTHGKTTTTAMLAMILREAGLQPSFLIGGDVHEVGAGAHWSGHELFVVEADESDGTFLELPLHATIVTNVETDHLDHYGTFAAIRDAFATYLGGVRGPRVVCIDEPTAASLAERSGAITYGTSQGAAYRAIDVVADRGALRWRVEHDGADLGELRLPLRGVHNARNATGAMVMALQLGATFADAAGALSRFGGVGRRFEFRGVDSGATFVDDYAHLPTEIAAVLEAAASSGDGWQRLVAVFQPNRFSRIERIWADYRDAFARADLVVLTEIYPSGEEPIPGVSGRLIADAVRAAHPQTPVVWLPKRSELIEYLARELRAGDVCVSMGCGDVASLPTEVLARRQDAREEARERPH